MKHKQKIVYIIYLYENDMRKRYNTMLIVHLDEKKANIQMLLFNSLVRIKIDEILLNTISNNEAKNSFMSNFCCFLSILFSPDFFYSYINESI